MSDFSVRSDNVDVEQIMRQIRARIREKRGVDYTEEEIRELANVKLEKFIDPNGVRSDLLQQYRQAREAALPPNYEFEDTTLFETHRGVLAFMRRLLRPILKLFFNPNPLIEALHIQSKLNEARAAVEPLHYEIVHNLVLELTRTSIEVKNLKMRLESMASRLDFDERRARALEGVVQYRPGAVPPLQPPTGQDQGRRDQGRRDQGGRPQGPRPQGPHPSQGRPPVSAVQGPPGAGSPVPSSSGQPSPAPGSGIPGSANALDNDGNERRARRRRRRGRRRPGERPGFGEGSSTGPIDGDAGRADERAPDREHPEERRESAAPLDSGPTNFDAGGAPPAAPGSSEPPSES